MHFTIRVVHDIPRRGLEQELTHAKDEEQNTSLFFRVVLRHDEERRLHVDHGETISELAKEESDNTEQESGVCFGFLAGCWGEVAHGETGQRKISVLVLWALRLNCYLQPLRSLQNCTALSLVVRRGANDLVDGSCTDESVCSALSALGARMHSPIIHTTIYQTVIFHRQRSDGPLIIRVSRPARNLNKL